MPPKRGSRLEQMKRDNKAKRIEEEKAEKSKLLDELKVKMQTIIDKIGECKSQEEFNEKIDKLCEVEATITHIRNGTPKKEAFVFIKEKFNEFMAISSRDKAAGVKYAEGLVAPARGALAETDPDAVEAIDSLIGIMQKASLACSFSDVATVLGGTDVHLPLGGAPE